jgi:hypothetical protein
MAEGAGGALMPCGVTAFEEGESVDDPRLLLALAVKA